MEPEVTRKLALKHQAASKSLNTLEKALAKMKDIEKFAAISESREEAKNLLQDSLIQRFEYTFDGVWKYLKLYLEQILKVSEPVKSPAAIFRSYLRTEFFTEEQIELAMRMLEHRNVTVHTYYEALADEVCTAIPAYYDLMKAFLQKAIPA